MVTDLTDKHTGTHRKRPRDWSAVSGITLHQTACLLGERPARWHSLRAHIGVTREGQILLVNPLDTVVYHGNGFNSRDVGMEIDGHFAGVEGDLRTYWRPKGSDRTPLSPAEVQIQAARDAVRWIVETVASHGGRVRYIHAHRQSSATRQSDPGSAIWQGVGVWAREALGLDDGGPGYKVGSGRPIPREWDPRHSAPY